MATFTVTIEEPGWHDVQDYGAIGDGTLHPVSDAHSDVAEARAEFGLPDLELTDSLDWAAHQAAMNACAESGGGIVYTPPGTYVCNRTLILPRQAKFGDERRATVWTGAGDRASVVYWPADFAGFSVYCEGRDIAHADQGQHAEMRDIQLRGPAYSQERTLGVATCEMHGLALGPGRDLDNVRIVGFNRGLCVKGGQMVFRKASASQCHFSLWFDPPLSNDYGDLLFQKCWFNDATMAALGVAKDSTVAGVHFVGCYIGGAPYAIFGEAGGNDRYLLSDVTFQSVQFEWVGNALLWDDNWTAAAGAASERSWSIRRVRFRDAYYHNDTSGQANLLEADGRGRHYVAFLRHMEEFEIDGMREAGFAWQPGSEGFFSCFSATGEISGDLDAILADCDAAGARLFCEMGNFPFSRVRLKSRLWEGCIARLTPAGNPAPVVANDVIEHGEDASLYVRPANWGSAQRLFGVARSAADPGEWFAVAQSGVCKVKVSAPLTANGRWIVADRAPGVYGSAVAASDPCRGVIGRNMNTNAIPDVSLDV